jgi:hypothetical protein
MIRLNHAASIKYNLSTYIIRTNFSFLLCLMLTEHKKISRPTEKFGRPITKRKKDETHNHLLHFPHLITDTLLVSCKPGQQLLK